MPRQEIWQDSKLVSAHDPRSRAEARAERVALLATQRYQIEVGGHTTAAGVPVLTDDRSKTLISAAADRARRGVQTIFQFKDAGGNTQTLNATQMAALNDDVGAFVQAAFAREAAIAETIAATASNDGQHAATGDNADIDAIDVMSGWPT